MPDLNTSEQRLPIASLRGTPVIFSAAQLKDVMHHPASTVKTPSEMLSRMVSVSTGTRDDGFILRFGFEVMDCFVFAVTSFTPGF
jgi:hypothetical protein